MRLVASAMILSLLTVPSALAAADAAPSQTLLTPGKPAGLRQAQETDTTVLLFAGAAALGIGIALAVSGDDDVTPPAVTTTGTSP